MIYNPGEYSECINKLPCGICRLTGQVPKTTTNQFYTTTSDLEYSRVLDYLGCPKKQKKKRGKNERI